MSEALLYTHTHTHTHTKVYTFGIYLGVELLDHIGSLCLTIEEVPYSFPQQLHHFSHPWYKRFHYLHILANVVLHFLKVRAILMVPSP